ncbi:MAG TPA: STAS domain-containing protein [Gaiellaceae bacterium]
MSPQPISVNVERDRAVVTLRGEHEAYTADKLARQLTALLEEGLPVSIDLRDATFIDSTVVGVLIAARRRADERGLAFEMVLGRSTGWPVRRMLEITGLEEQLHVVD